MNSPRYLVVIALAVITLAAFGCSGASSDDGVSSQSGAQKTAAPATDPTRQLEGDERKKVMALIHEKLDPKLEEQGIQNKQIVVKRAALWEDCGYVLGKMQATGQRVEVALAWTAEGSLPWAVDDIRFDEDKPLTAEDMAEGCYKFLAEPASR